MAPAPMAPTAVAFGAAPAELELEPAAPVAPGAPLVSVTLACGIPEVNGVSVTEEAPEKTGVAVEAVALGEAVEAAGLRTLWHISDMFGRRQE